MKSIVTIGGGTGQFTLLSGLKKFPVRLTAIVTMADNGGSTGLLRDELGVLPPGDIRQCLVALSDADAAVMRDLFNYRYENGGLKGHNFGNIFLSTLEKITGSFEQAVQVAGSVLRINGQVIPVTTANMNLVCNIGDETLVGEHDIALKEGVGADALSIEPAVYANPRAVEAIENADCIVIGPGNLFCSILPNLMVKGISEAIARSKAKVVYNCNLMTSKGHTDDYSVTDYANVIESRIGTGRLQYVTFNRAIPAQDVLDWYESKGVSRVRLPEDGFAGVSYEPLGADLISKKTFAQKANDTVQRSLIRHDSDALAALIIERCIGGL